MDWSNQSQDMFKSWSETQKKMWESFNNSMSNFQGSPDQKMWEQTLATGQKAIETTLNAQTDWAKKWVESYSLTWYLVFKQATEMADFPTVSYFTIYKKGEKKWQVFFM